MTIDQDLLDMLRCPETHQKLTIADTALVERLNQRIAEGTLVNRGGEKVNEPVDGGLVREDQQILYPVRDEIPEMLIESGVELAKVG